MKVTFANACYSGGGIYLYIGALNDGKYFFASDEFGAVYMDVMPDFNYTMEFFDSHCIGYIEDDSEELKELFTLIYKWIEENAPEGNHNIDELSDRRTKGGYFQAVENDILLGRSLDSAMQSN